MIDLRTDTVVLALLLVILVVLIGSAIRHRGVPARGRPLTYAGFGLLLLGNLLYFADHILPSSVVAALPDLQTRTTIQNLVCFRGGLLLLAAGLIRVMPDVAAIERSRRLLATMGDGDDQAQYVRGLLNSILKSSLGGTLSLKPIRDRTNDVVDFECILANPAAGQILGRSPSELVGARLLETFPCIRTHGLLDQAVNALETGRPFMDERFCTDARGGRWFQIAAVKHSDTLTVTFADITDRKRIEEQLRYSAEHDALTGLANRALLRQRLEQSLARSREDPSYKFAVFFLDFDRFKLINDSLGHQVGDQLLISIAERLRANLRAIDQDAAGEAKYLAARLGGDEFVVFLDDVREACNATIAAERLQQDLSQPHRIAGYEVISTASIGIVVNSHEYEDSDEILRDADTAMYEAKSQGKARHAVFSDVMRQTVLSKLEMETDLRDAVERRSFFLEYQPIVSLADGSVVGLEALVRWAHPDRGVILPGRFVTIAEELGIIVPVGEWVLGQACQALQRWHERFPHADDLHIAVNLSKTELINPGLLPMVERTLKETKLDPGLLQLEVTESTVMNNAEVLIPIVQQLKSLGVRLVVDDFGTGHSSLSCLDQLPFDVLKIDRTFIRSTRKKREYAAIIDSIVVLAHNLAMPVVAEGIETEDQLTLLQALECDFGQGWLFSDALNTDRVDQLLGKTTGERLAA